MLSTCYADISSNCSWAQCVSRNDTTWLNLVLLALAALLVARFVATMASKDDHCLLDLLWRNRCGELEMSP